MIRGLSELPQPCAQLKSVSTTGEAAWVMSVPPLPALAGEKTPSRAPRGPTTDPERLITGFPVMPPEERTSNPPQISLLLAMPPDSTVSEPMPLVVLEETTSTLITTPPKTKAALAVPP